MTSQDIKVGAIRVDDVRFHHHNIRRDLGDLRTLTASITRYGVMQPVVVENHGSYFRLRAGHRRVAAARLARLTKVPAVIHETVLEDDEWIIASIQENVMRRGIDKRERRDAILALRDLGCSWGGIAETFGVSTTTVQKWLQDDEARRRNNQRTKALRVQVRPVRDFIAHWSEIAATDDTVTAQTVLDALADLLDQDVARKAQQRLDDSEAAA